MLHLYNTLTKQKEEFVPIEKGKVGLYTCGPTVYDYVHIGNLRAYTTADLLRRYLAYTGYEVRHIKNITDVGHLTDDDVAQGDSGEDKLIKKSVAEKKTPEEIARFYENYAKEVESELNIIPAQYFPRATEHIPHMIALIEKLITNGNAYEAHGNVFLDVTTVDDYGKLSGNTLENLNIGARLAEPHPDKRHQWDFALWLRAPENHLMQWDSPWSRGYPGWHIECSAMSTQYLGESFDIHTGGEDNIFPHHEAEIAQIEPVSKKQFVKYWVHSRFLLVDGEKMSKSQGSFYTMEDVKKHGYSAMHLRMIYLLSHYRSQMNFTWKSMAQAKKNFETLEKFYQRLCTENSGTENFDIQKYQMSFETAMNDDLNTPLAIAELLQMTKDGNALLDMDGITNTDEAKKLFVKLTDALGLTLTEKKTRDVPPDIQELVQQREDVRAKKDFNAADKIRDQISDAGYDIEDTPDGVTVVKK